MEWVLNCLPTELKQALLSHCREMRLTNQFSEARDLQARAQISWCTEFKVIPELSKDSSVSTLVSNSPEQNKALVMARLESHASSQVNAHSIDPSGSLNHFLTISALEVCSHLGDFMDAQGSSAAANALALQMGQDQGTAECFSIIALTTFGDASDPFVDLRCPPNSSFTSVVNLLQTCEVVPSSD